MIAEGEKHFSAIPTSHQILNQVTPILRTSNEMGLLKNNCFNLQLSSCSKVQDNLPLFDNGESIKLREEGLSISIIYMIAAIRGATLETPFQMVPRVSKRLPPEDSDGLFAALSSDETD